MFHPQAVQLFIVYGLVDKSGLSVNHPSVHITICGCGGGDGILRQKHIRTDEMDTGVPGLDRKSVV